MNLITHQANKKDKTEEDENDQDIRCQYHEHVVSSQIKSKSNKKYKNKEDVNKKLYNSLIYGKSPEEVQEKYTFFCQTTEAVIIKYIVDIMYVNVKCMFLDLKQEGIFMQTVNSDESMLFHLELFKDNFNHFMLSGSYQIGLTLKYLYTLMKNVKKKDCIELFIEKNNELHLGIHIFSEYQRYCTSYIKIHSIQNILVMLPTGYDVKHSININTIDFHKACKELNEINNNVTIYADVHSVVFSSKIQNVYSKNIIFLDYFKGNDIRDKDTDFENYLYKLNIDVDKFLKILKITGLQKTFQMYFEPNLPLFLKIKTGSLGVFFIYIIL